MKEKLLQYIWQFQHYNLNELTTTAGDTLQIIHPGSINTNQGPDFLEAKIKLNNTIWVGNIELHIKGSDWNLHGHSSDDNYNNIILHVVWENDIAIKDKSGKCLPTLVLHNRVSKILLEKYTALMNSKFFIPCEKQIHSVNDLTLTSWKQRMIAERLEDRSKYILQTLEQNNFHWEETFWRLIAKNFGIQQNSDAFENIAASLPVNILAKHKNQIHQLEALLFGQAGLLNTDFVDEYTKMLQREFIFLKKKYKLKNTDTKIFFLRMRPANFPTIRLAQLAMLVNKSSHLFSNILDETNIEEVKTLLNVTANDYWHYHYVFDELSAFKKKNLGVHMINNILINTIVPILFTYGFYHNKQLYKEKAITWLEEISSEKNNITKGFEALKLSHKSSFDSQAFIQLKNIYCNHKRCIECAVGNALLKSTE